MAKVTSYKYQIRDTRNKTIGWSEYELKFHDVRMWVLSNIRDIPFEMALEEVLVFIRKINCGARRSETFQEFIDRYLSEEIITRTLRKNRYTAECIATPFLSAQHLKIAVWDLIQKKKTPIQGFTNDKYDGQLVINAKGWRTRHDTKDDITGVTSSTWDDIFVFGIVSDLTAELAKGRGIKHIKGKCGVIVTVTYNPELLGEEFFALVSQTIDDKYEALYGN